VIVSGKSGRYVDILYLADRQEVVPIIATWIYNEWSYLYPEMTRLDVLTLLRERINKEELPLTLVAFEAGEPIGTVSLRTFDMETRRDLQHWLTSLYVIEPWRRKGIGSSLVGAAEKKAAELNIDKLFLFTTDAALHGRFYATLGWAVKETATYRSCPVMIMEKALHREQRS
jgi:predicted N-acetyltransferase YhbS